MVFYVLDQNFDFLRKTDRFWDNILYVQEFFWAKSLQKTCLYVHEKLQRNPSVGSCLFFFILWPYGFDYLGFLTNARRDAMLSKTQWVFYRDLDWWPGPQKVQFLKITGYPEVVWLILALLSCDALKNLICFELVQLSKFKTDQIFWVCQSITPYNVFSLVIIKKEFSLVSTKSSVSYLVAVIICSISYNWLKYKLGKKQ